MPARPPTTSNSSCCRLQKGCTFLLRSFSGLLHVSRRDCCMCTSSGRKHAPPVHVCWGSATHLVKSLLLTLLCLFTGSLQGCTFARLVLLHSCFCRCNNVIQTHRTQVIYLSHFISWNTFHILVSYDGIVYIVTYQGDCQLSACRPFLPTSLNLVWTWWYEVKLASGLFPLFFQMEQQMVGRLVMVGRWLWIYYISYIIQIHVVHTLYRYTSVHYTDTHPYIIQIHIHTLYRYTSIHYTDTHPYIIQIHIRTLYRYTSVHYTDTHPYIIIHTHPHNIIQAFMVVFLQTPWPLTWGFIPKHESKL